MPYMNSLKIDEERMKEVLRVKENLGTTLKTPLNLPDFKFKTTFPKEQLGLDEWFAYIKNTLREKDKTGKITIK